MIYFRATALSSLRNACKSHLNARSINVTNNFSRTSALGVAKAFSPFSTLQPATRIYLSGLPYSATEHELENWIIDEAGVDPDSIATVKIHVRRDTGESRGTASIEFNNPEAAEQSLSAHDKYMGKRYIGISLSKGSPGLKKLKRFNAELLPAGLTSLFLRNLPYVTDEAAVAESFEAFGKVKSVSLDFGPDGRGSGTGNIEFESHDSVKQIMETDLGASVEGRVIHCYFEPEQKVY